MMAISLFLVFLRLVLSYTMDDIGDVPLPPSYMEQQQYEAPQANPYAESASFREMPSVYSPQNYLDAYAQAGNEPLDGNAYQYEQQEIEYPQGQYPRMRAQDGPSAETSGVTPIGTAPVSQTTTTVSTQISQSQPQAPAPAPQPDPHYSVLPVYTPPKNKHTEKEEDPYISPEWDSDAGVGNGRDPKIVAAIEAITADLIGKGKELTSERHWTKEVESMLEIYKGKVENVHHHVEKLREEMKTLLKKKRQIENVEVQQQLNQKLRLAQEDLEALDGAMSHVQSKAEEFAEKKKSLEGRIGKIEGQIKELQGGHGSENEGEKNEGEKKEGEKEKKIKTETVVKSETKEEKKGAEEGTTTKTTLTKTSVEEEKKGVEEEKKGKSEVNEEKKGAEDGTTTKTTLTTTSVEEEKKAPASNTSSTTAAAKFRSRRSKKEEEVLVPEEESTATEENQETEEIQEEENEEPQRKRRSKRPETEDES